MLDAVSLRLPKYRHHKAKNLAVVSIAGRDIYLGKYNSSASKQEYRRLVAEYVQTGAARRADTAAETTVFPVTKPTCACLAPRHRTRSRIEGSLLTPPPRRCGEF